MPDLKEVIERLEGEAKECRRNSQEERKDLVWRAAYLGRANGLEHALSALKPLLEKNDG